MVKLRIKGLNKVQDGLKKVITKDLPLLVAEELQKEIKNNVMKFSDTGDLYRSIKVVTRGRRHFITSNLPYANIQDKGGRIIITQKMRSKMWALYMSTGNNMYKYIAISKKNYVVINAKHYTNVDVKKVIRNAKHRLRIKLR
jgi:hypothetical protein